jgi:DNA-binding HxlR family transcriptional regulator
MLTSPEGIATNILSDRLHRLADAGLIVREPDTDDQRQWIYRPTEKALGLVPMLAELIVWSARNDPRTAVPRTFIEQFDDDREGLIEGIKARFAEK